MSSDHQRQLAIDRILSSVREAAESSLRSYASAVAESATDELWRQSTVESATLRDTIQRLEITRIDVESQLAEARRLLDDARRDAEQLVADADIARDSAVAAERLRADAAIGEAARLAEEEISAVQRATEARVAALTTQLAAAESDVRRSRLLMRTIASLDGATSLGDVLKELSEFAAQHAPRAAVFVVRDRTLSCWRTIGFDPQDQPGLLANLADEHSIVATALSQRHMTVHPAASDHLSSTVVDAAITVAAPVSVAGRVVAVVYAENTEPDSRLLHDWCPSLETVARYAGRTLETLTIQLALRAGTSMVQPSHEPPGHPLPRGLS